MQAKILHATSKSPATGFRDPVLGAQSTFRAVMMAMAEPGTIHDLPDLPHPPAGLDAGLAAVALTLLDHETPVWLDEAFVQAAGVADYLRFNTGARIVAETHGAAFALVGDFAGLPRLAQFAQGTLEYPDRSTTLVVAARVLRSGAGLTLTGPGIATSARLAVDPLPPDWSAQLATNRAHYPLGVDFIFANGSRVAALPRSTRVVS